ncbi:inositol polyphosphate-5-phosphatase A-like [Betta splendens]|uniref:inositol-polyphosphate 5-phosphatase n=1 Tax=Betta splendens TaxID=158456 RepID=A0A6P7PQ35_BETSP|nr:inositol polyphosphate-5-phosphatase A-like [Betta splendens]XP_055358210.1 inositol polyphosphate-5-phosphatase A-like [Betta splendens]
MARRQTEAEGAGILLVTANVGSLFEDPENLQKTWLREFNQTVQTQKPQFLAVHCQEVGGKNCKASMAHVRSFVGELMSIDAMKEFNRARIYIDENYDSQEHFTALGSFYFVHDSLLDIRQFDFKALRFRRVLGRESFSELERTTTLQKEKFPQHYFPESKWSRKGFTRTRWFLGGRTFDLVNIHLFHDASNLVAWEKSPSVYSETRKKALDFVLDRISDWRYQKLPYFVFGDFNFRLDSMQVIKSLCTSAIEQKFRNTDNEVEKIIFRESDNDKKVILELEKKLFEYINQDVFRQNNGISLRECDKELSAFKDKLIEMDICFPPSYPYSEDSSEGNQYMNTRCPAWCDRILMSPSARDLLDCDDSAIVYNNIGSNVCMGDHKPVFLSFQLPRKQHICLLQ